MLQLPAVKSEPGDWEGPRSGHQLLGEARHWPEDTANGWRGATGTRQGGGSDEYAGRVMTGWQQRLRCSQIPPPDPGTLGVWERDQLHSEPGQGD